MKTIHSVTPEDLKPHLTIGTNPVSEQDFYIAQGHLGCVEAVSPGSWTGFCDGYLFQTDVAVVGSDYMIRRGASGLAQLHESGRFVNVIPTGAALDSRIYELDNSEGDLKTMLLEGVTRSLHDLVNGRPGIYPADLAKQQHEIIDGMAILLDVASGIAQHS